MSVSPSTPHNLPLHRRPPALGGTGKDPVFAIAKDALGNALVYRADPHNPQSHGFVEPAVTMETESYQRALCDSRLRWEHS